MRKRQIKKILKLKELLSNLQPHICSFLCDSVYPTGTPEPHSDECIAITEILKQEEN